MISRLSRFSRAKTSFVALSVLTLFTGLIGLIGGQWIIAGVLLFVALTSFLLAKIASKATFPKG